MKELRNKIKEQLSSKFIMGLKIIIALILITINYSCDFKVRKTFGACSSSSISISKERNVFLWSYQPFKMNLFDTINISSTEIFAEKKYKTVSYDDNNYEVNDKESQIVINFDKNLYKSGCSYTWRFKDFGEISQSRVLGKYNFVQESDSILVSILRVETNSITGSSGKNDGKIIGNFILKRIK